MIVLSALPDEQNRLCHHTYRLHLWLQRAALIWLVTAVARVGIDASNAAGAPLSRVLADGALDDALAASESARGWIVAALAAAVVANSRPDDPGRCRAAGCQRGGVAGD